MPLRSCSCHFCCPCWSKSGNSARSYSVTFAFAFDSDRSKLQKRFASAVVASATFFGAFVGTFLWGPISDKYGRRIGYLATTVFTSVFGLASALAPNLGSLIVLRALLGVGIGGTPVAFSMFSEFLPVKNRGRILVRPRLSLSHCGGC